MAPRRSRLGPSTSRIAYWLWDSPWDGYFAVRAALLGLLAPEALQLSGSGFSWIKIAIMMWLPSPFLGGGANRDWAERKRAELRERRVGREKQDDLHKEPFVRSHEALEGTQDNSSKGGRDHAKMNERLFDSALNGDETALFQSWLERTGHQDDAWAQKILGRSRG